MSLAASLVVLGWLAATPPVASVPPPPGGTYEEAITKVVTARAQKEMKALVAELEKDPSQPSAFKAEVKRKLARLKVAVYTTPKSFEETVAFYEASPLRPFFLKGDRDLLADLRENAEALGASVDPAAEKAWAGKAGRTARWTRDDNGLQITVEDHLIDPRDGSVTKKTVVLVTSLDD